MIDVKSKTVEQIIYETKGRPGAEREEQIGFIDIECVVKYPYEISLASGLPYDLRELDIHLRHYWNDTTKLDEFEEPTWEVSTTNETVWIDIRPDLPKLGQLLRELKTLRSYAPENSFICVVTSVADKQSIEILAAEGFILIPHEWLITALTSR